MHREQPALVDTYSSPVIEKDVGLAQRVAALESWALNVDTKLRSFDQKLSRLDSLDAYIERHSLKVLQQNLIQTLSTNDNIDTISEKLKAHFDKYYTSNSKTDGVIRDVEERIASAWKPDMSEDNIRRIVEEHMSAMERRHMEVLIEKVREHVKEIEREPSEVNVNVEEIKRIVAAMLDVYDADKTGLVDYALESAGEVSEALTKKELK